MSTPPPKPPPSSSMPSTVGATQPQPPLAEGESAVCLYSTATKLERRSATFNERLLRVEHSAETLTTADVHLRSRVYIARDSSDRVADHRQVVLEDWLMVGYAVAHFTHRVEFGV